MSVNKKKAKTHKGDQRSPSFLLNQIYYSFVCHKHFNIKNPFAMYNEKSITKGSNCPKANLL